MLCTLMVQVLLKTQKTHVSKTCCCCVSKFSALQPVLKLFVDLCVVCIRLGVMSCGISGSIRLGVMSCVVSGSIRLGVMCLVVH